MKKVVLTGLVLLSGVSCIATHAASKPRRVAADRHIRLVQYDPNNVVVLQGRYGYQTQITFGANEIVQNVSLGDSLAWQAVPVGNNLFIKPVASSKTNMTVLTNVNSYNFQLDSKETNVAPVYLLRFKYSDDRFDNTFAATSSGNFNPEQLNWKYSYTGESSIAPATAFDDGKFTWFKFKNDGMSHLPAVYIVDKDRKESLINYHMQGEYMVVNAVAKQFTLRNGSYVTSVYNDQAIGDWKQV